MATDPVPASDEERYLIIKGRRWRRIDPSIPEALKEQLVRELMAARRAVKAAGANDDAEALAAARARVGDAKHALGERGRPWWEPPEREAVAQRLTGAIRCLLRGRAAGASICPSEAARVAGGENWRTLLPLATEIAWQLQQEGWLDVMQRGTVASRPTHGPIRLRRREDGRDEAAP